MSNQNGWPPGNGWPPAPGAPPPPSQPQSTPGGFGQAPPTPGGFAPPPQQGYGQALLRRASAMVRGVFDRFGDRPVLSGVTAPLGAVTRRTLPPDEQVSAKLDPYITQCLNRFSSSVLRSRRRYLSWTTAVDGPTGRERNVFGLFQVSGNPADCAAAAQRSAQMQPSLPDVEAAAQRYIAALQTVQPVIEQAHAYYSRNNYRDDQMAQGRAMHAPLMQASQFASTRPTGSSRRPSSTTRSWPPRSSSPGCRATRRGSSSTASAATSASPGRSSTSSTRRRSPTKASSRASTPRRSSPSPAPTRQASTPWPGTLWRGPRRPRRCGCTPATRAPRASSSRLRSPSPAGCGTTSRTTRAISKAPSPTAVTALPRRSSASSTTSSARTTSSSELQLLPGVRSRGAVSALPTTPTPTPNSPSPPPLRPRAPRA
ncbi:MAG: DUF3829 domain-containing protein [Deltaproteobacteria bacterium]|nr:DUF3829 domain-containing protein [Deltaproteobacteria bacterium]